MLFNSLEFFLFFPIVTVLYFILPHRFRWLLLLVASCVFYMAFVPVYILILLFTIIIDYYAGILIENATGHRRKSYLTMSLIANIGVLAVFKYYNFAADNLNALAHFLHWNYSLSALGILLPIGLSFHTFQAMSYTIEVYRGHQKAERHFGIYALYVMFYPQLVAGPIERPQNLIHQFYEKHEFDYERVTDGLKLMAWGLFKKAVIADRLALLVNTVYNHPTDYQGIMLILATVFFAFQIYCDFSGYSDIAIGAAQVMGFKLMTNFNRPYSAHSIAEFWKRWHISLSTWFKDYLYISLGGNRVAPWRWQFNLFITFLISGLWHGASWTFVAWGALNGFYLVFSLWTQELRRKLVHSIGLDKMPRLRSLLQVCATFCLICLAWIFFRANSMADALYIITHLTSGVGEFIVRGFSAVIHRRSLGLNLGVSKTELLIVIAAIIFMEAVQILQGRESGMRHLLNKKPVWIRWGIYYMIMLTILFLGVFTKSQFIYFQF